MYLIMFKPVFLLYIVYVHLKVLNIKNATGDAILVSLLETLGDSFQTHSKYIGYFYICQLLKIF